MTGLLLVQTDMSSPRDDDRQTWRIPSTDPLWDHEAVDWEEVGLAEVDLVVEATAAAVREGAVRAVLRVRAAVVRVGSVMEMV